MNSVFASSATYKYSDWQNWTSEQETLNTMAKDCKQPAFDTFYGSVFHGTRKKEKKKNNPPPHNFVCLCDSKLPHFQSHHLSTGHILNWLWTLNIYYKVISETFLIQISIVSSVLIILISLVTCNSKITPKTSLRICLQKVILFWPLYRGKQ